MTLLALLDMSATFDCVDHYLLLQQLQLSFGITGTSMTWIRSILFDETYQLAYGGELCATYVLQTTVHAFIARHLDWCNSLLYGVPENLLRKVLSVQNAAARLLTNTRRRDHITPVLHQLHWLSVQRRVDFKIACLAHQSITSTSPTYLSADIQLICEHGRCHLCSSSYRTLAVPRM